MVILYSRDVYGVYNIKQGTHNVYNFVVRKARFV